MKIGIITYHRAHNYGAVLQCFALQEVLKTLGYDTVVIDYRQQDIEELYNPSKIKLIKANIFHPRSLANLRLQFRKIQNKSEIFSTFTEGSLNLTRPCSYNTIPACDVYVVGSDQMWSIDCVGGCIDPVYFGEFARTPDSKIIGFSISSNIHSLDVLGDRLSDYIGKFENISFRESLIASEVQKRTSISKEVTLDPTLCTDASIWDGILNHKWKKRKYIVLYHVKLRFANIVHKMLLNQAHRLATEHGWEVIDLSTGEYSVSDFVSAIKYAQCVLTSSFHATVFSVIFSKNLFSVKLHDGNDARYVDLLHTLGMDSALVDLDFSESAPKVFDYSIIQERLRKLRQPSINFLTSNI